MCLSTDLCAQFNTKHVMRYLKGTLDYGLRYASDGEIRLHEFADSDWAGSVEDRKSTSGCCFSLGSDMISWFSRKQSNIALSTTEFEYITTCSSDSCKTYTEVPKRYSGLWAQI